MRRKQRAAGSIGWQAARRGRTAGAALDVGLLEGVAPPAGVGPRARVEEEEEAVQVLQAPAQRRPRDAPPARSTADFLHLSQQTSASLKFRLQASPGVTVLTPQVATISQTATPDEYVFNTTSSPCGCMLTIVSSAAGKKNTRWLTLMLSAEFAISMQRVLPRMISTRMCCRRMVRRAEQGTCAGPGSQRPGQRPLLLCSPPSGPHPDTRATSAAASPVSAGSAISSIAPLAPRPP